MRGSLALRSEYPHCPEWSLLLVLLHRGLFRAGTHEAAAWWGLWLVVFGAYLEKNVFVFI